MTSNQNAVVAALEAALHDHGWAVATDPARLRATLSDLLGAEADNHRGALDAIVVSVEEGVPAGLRDAGREAAREVRPELVARLEDWGMAEDRAAWVVDAWESLLPETTAAPPATLPPPVVVPVDFTQLPPVDADPAVTSPPPTALPVAMPVPMPVAMPVPMPVALPPARSPAAPLPTSLPPAADDRTSLPPRPPVDPAPRDVVEDVVEVPAEGCQAEPGEPRRARWLWVAAGTAVVVVGGTWGALAATGDDPERIGTTAPSSSPSASAPVDPGPRTMASGQLIATDAAAPARSAGTHAIGGRVGGVRLTHLGPIDQFGTGDNERIAAPGSQLVGFTVAKGPCQERPCRDVAKLGLKVSIDGTLKVLPRGGPTYVVAAPEGAIVELVYDADGFDQRLSLVNGEATGNNIGVLARSDRTTRVGATEVIRPTASIAVANLDRKVKVGKAELFFFDGREGLPRTARAYLRIDVTYTRPDTSDRFLFYLEETTFVADGTVYRARNLDPSDGQDAVFVVPADVTRGKLVIAGTRDAVTERGTGYTLTIPRTTFPVRFDQAG